MPSVEGVVSASQGFQQEHDHWCTSQAHMTIIIVCESTRPRVQRETVVSSVPSVLLQGTTTRRISYFAVSTGRTSLRRWEISVVLEMSERLTVKLVGELDAGRVLFLREGGGVFFGEEGRRRGDVFGRGVC